MEETQSEGEVSGSIPSARALLVEAWSSYKQNWRVLASIMLPLFAAQMLYYIVVFFSDRMAGAGSETSISQLLFIEIGGKPISPILLSIMVLASLFASIALILAIIRSQDRISFQAAYRLAGSKLIPFIWLGVLLNLAVVVGFLLLIIPGVIAIVWFAFAPFVLLEEDVRGTQALRRSRDYVRGRWKQIAWRLFVVFVLIILVSVAVTTILIILSVLGGFLLGLIPGTAGGVKIATAGVLASLIIDTGISTLILQPFAVIYAYLLYKKVRSVAEIAKTK